MFLRTVGIPFFIQTEKSELTEQLSANRRELEEAERRASEAVATTGCVRAEAVEAAEGAEERHACELADVVTAGEKAVRAAEKRVRRRGRQVRALKVK
jgi:hypothetical protein